MFYDNENDISKSWRNGFILPTSADAAVRALRLWLERYGGEGGGPLWSPRQQGHCCSTVNLQTPGLGKDSVGKAGTNSRPARMAGSMSCSGSSLLNRGDLLERKRSHTEHCSACKSASVLTIQAHRF